MLPEGKDVDGISEEEVLEDVDGRCRVRRRDGRGRCNGEWLELNGDVL